MRPHPRIRKAVKRGGVAATVLLAAVWIGSGKWSLWLQTGQGNFGLTRGVLRVGLHTSDVGIAPTTRFLPTQGAFCWRYAAVRTRSMNTYMLPLWPLVAASFLIGAAAWRLDVVARRRIMLGRCAKCDYDRSGLAPGAVCPECGTAESGVSPRNAPVG